MKLTSIKIKHKYLFITLLLSFSLKAFCEQNPQKISALYKSLDPYSISSYLAFWQLYPSTIEGQSALKKAFTLLGSKDIGSLEILTSQTLQNSFQSLIQLVNQSWQSQSTDLNLCEIELIENLGSILTNRKLKGHNALCEQEVIELKDDEVDLARGLLLSQLDDSDDKIYKIRQYEALIDLMALQILAKLKPKGGLKASSEDKIESINNFIFNDLHFRFPPHSTYAPDIDQYTFLPSVLDGRRGVCLGVSILYLCLSQRLDLQLEVITPPGHIFVRHKSPSGSIINIETTARGANTNTETYLGINTKTLQQRTIKQTIGLAHQNQASVYSHQENFQKAVFSYKKAYKYLPDDQLIKELLGYHLLFINERQMGIELLSEVKAKPYLGSCVSDPMAEDYLNGLVDEEGIQAVFQNVDDTMQSIIKKKERLERVLEKYPRFRSGLVQLATAYLQLAKSKKALDLLKCYHDIDPNDPTVEYYLSVLYLERHDFVNAWLSCLNTQVILKYQNHEPKALKEIKVILEKTCPQ
jgi:regulator of sirC expression with transglutaminase-like and TPR domain